MPPRKPIRRPKQEPPIAFRPGPELAQMVSAIAQTKSVGTHECYKHLAALAVVGLDVRYYDLVAAFAAAQSGANPFTRAVIQLHTASTAAVRLDPRYAHEPLRTKFLVNSVIEQLSASKNEISPDIIHQLLVSTGLIPIRGLEVHQLDEEPIPSDAQNQQERIPIRLT